MFENSPSAGRSFQNEDETVVQLKPGDDKMKDEATNEMDGIPESDLPSVEVGAQAAIGLQNVILTLFRKCVC